MMSQQMQDLVQGQLEAYNEGDVETFCTYFHNDIVAVDLFTGKVVMSGMAEFKKRYASVFASSPDLHCEIKSRIVLNSTILDEEIISGSTKYPEGKHAVAIYAFADGKINRFTVAD